MFEDYKASATGDCFEDLAGGSSTAENWGNFPLSESNFWGCDRGIEVTKAGGMHLSRIMAANNRKSQIAVMETDGSVKHEFDRAVSVRDSIMIGYTDAHPTFAKDGGMAGQMGLETPWKKGTFFSDGSSFHNMGDGVGVNPCYSSYPFDCVNTQWFSKTAWGNDITKKTKFDWEHELQLIDTDGTYTETGIPKIVIRKTDIVPMSQCSDAAEHSTDSQPGMYCNYPNVYLLRTGFNSPDPDSLLGFPTLVTTQHGESYIPFRFKRSTHGFGWTGFLAAEETNKLEWEPFRVNHTFNGEMRYFKPDTWVRVEAVFDEDIDRMEWGSDKGQGTNRTVEGGVPDFNDENLSYELASRTAIFHNYGGSSLLNDQKESFTYRAYVPQVESALDDENAISGECVWSDVTCWDGGVLPSSGDVVEITAGHRMFVDVEDVEIDYIYVMGQLRFNDTMEHYFKVKGMQVGGNSGYSASTLDSAARRRRQAGKPILTSRVKRSGNDTYVPTDGGIEIGTSDSPWPCDKSIEIRLSGDYTDTVGAYLGSAPIGAKAIAAFKGVRMHGCAVSTTTAILKSTVSSGDTTIELAAAPVGWKVGGKVVIAPSGVEFNRHDEMEISAINGAQITFTSGLSFDHTGKDNSEFTYANGRTVDQGAEVIYLTRNVKLSAENQATDAEWNYGIGGRLLVSRRYAVGDENEDKYGWAQLDNVQFDGFGQLAYSSTSDPRWGVAFYNTHGTQGTNVLRPVAESSFIRSCSFTNGYWTAIGTVSTDEVEISNNVVYNHIDAAIKIHASDDNIVDSNTVIYMRHKQMYVVEKGFSLNNSDIDVRDVPMVVEANTAGEGLILTNNRGAGLEYGLGFWIRGEACSDGEVCEAESTFTSGSLSSGNKVHAANHGLWILQDAAAYPCAKIAGFEFYLLHDVGIYTQARVSSLIIEDVVIYDTPMGVLPIIYDPDPITHIGQMQTVSVRNSVFGGLSDTFDCSKVATWHSMMDYGLFAKMSPQHPDGTSRKEWVGFSDSICWNMFNKFPKKPVDKWPADGGNPTLYCRTCFHDTHFESFTDKCADMSTHYAHAQHRGALDTSGPTTFYTGNSITGTPDANKVKFLNPLSKFINPSDCVDMSCDKHRRALINDDNGMFFGSAKALTAHTDYEWAGNPVFGLYDNRIPITMRSDANGSPLDLNVHFPNKGAHRGSDCSFNSVINGYECGDELKYNYFIMESMDADTEIRRLSPIGIRSQDGHIDLINGPGDHSCCSGYACQIRISLFRMLFACGQEYDVHATSTGWFGKNVTKRTEHGSGLKVSS